MNLAAPAALVLLCLAPARAQQPDPPRGQAPPESVPSVAAIAAPKVRIAGVAVIRETLEFKNTRYTPFGLETGTRVSLVFHSPTRRLLGLDPLASRLDSFADDAGTNLLAISHRLQQPGFLERGCGILADGNLAHVEISGGTPPAQGTTRLALRGTAVFLTATTRAQARSPAIAAGVGKVFHLGGNFAFTTTRWNSFDDKHTSVSLALHGDPRVFAAFRFLDAAGNEVPSRAARWDAWNNCKGETAFFHFQLSGNPATCALQATYWSDLQPLEAPFNLSSGIGE